MPSEAPFFGMSSSRGFALLSNRNVRRRCGDAEPGHSVMAWMIKRTNFLRRATAGCSIRGRIAAMVADVAAQCYAVREGPSMHDVAIIGGGHNGLVCAAYLAKAGLKVIVLEARSVVGGAAVTEEFHPGFRNSIAAYTVSLLNPKVIRDLDLVAHGLRIVERRVANFLPLDDGRYLKGGGGPTPPGGAEISHARAERLRGHSARLARGG